MPKLLQSKLELSRCPHCNVDTPNLNFCGQGEFLTFTGNRRFWRHYVCGRCAGVITASAPNWEQEIQELYPAGIEVSSDIPDRPRAYLEQAINSLSSPAGAVMLAASSVDAMLKERGLSKGNLNARIDQAASEHLITAEMAQWAHDIRLDANDQRHSDQDASLPTTEQAQKCVDFALALGQFLFVLPKRVERGIKNAKGNTAT